jgi:hypothetical protein
LTDTDTGGGQAEGAGDCGRQPLRVQSVSLAERHKVHDLGRLPSERAVAVRLEEATLERITQKDDVGDVAASEKEEIDIAGRVQGDLVDDDDRGATIEEPVLEGLDVERVPRPNVPYPLRAKVIARRENADGHRWARLSRQDGSEDLGDAHRFSTPSEAEDGGQADGDRRGVGIEHAVEGEEDSLTGSLLDGSADDGPGRVRF